MISLQRVLLVWISSWDEWVPESRVVKNDAAGKVRRTLLRELQKRPPTLNTKTDDNARFRSGKASSSSSGPMNGGESSRGTPTPVDVKGKGKEKEKDGDNGVIGAGTGNRDKPSGRKRNRGEAFAGDTVSHYFPICLLLPLRRTSSLWTIVVPKKLIPRICPVYHMCLLFLTTGGTIHETTRSEIPDSRLVEIEIS